MEQRIDEDLDGDVLASLSTIPPRRKVHSYSQQLGGTSTAGMIKRNQIRKHSLDEDRIPKNIERYYDSSDDEGYPNPSSSSSSAGASSTNFISSFSGGPGSCTERHEYMNQLLEMKQTNDSCSGGNEERRMDNRPLPEFIANGGGKGIFKVPVRAPEHPGRPPSLELRPHPLRETQIGSFIRAIACTENQLWGGQECGVRFWNFTDIYEPGCRIEGLVKKGDEDGAPFHQSTQTPPTNCFIVDQANKLVWSGHKDGKIRSWKMDQTLEGGTAFKEGLSWNAHRGPVLSMVIDSYGDLWSGSEGGVVKIWPWETIEKSLSLSAGERHMAALLVERSFIDLKSKVTVNGVCSISASDVKYLLSDYSRAKIWSAGYLSFALWDARTRELLKVFNIDGQIENRADMSSGHDVPIEEEMKVKLVSTSKKEKSQGPLSFFQRSRNALMGAADAVRRVAAKGGLVEDNKRTEALVMTMDGMIWTGLNNGYLVQWDGNGNRLQDFNHHHFAVQCLCTFGARIWVGYASGTVQVLDLEGNLIGAWIAHSCPVIRMTLGAGYVFTLANHGGIRGWNMASPCPLDNILRSELASKELLHMKLENLKILVGTWNVGQGRASLDALRLWLGSAASEVGIVVVGLQEVEMGAGFLAMSAARETVGLEGSSIGQWWMDAIGRSLDEGTTFDRVGSRQLAGLLIAVWVRSTLRPQVGDIDAAAVPCGFGRAIGNKGGVGVRMRVYDRKICFVNCHLAAHLEAVTRRNADFDHIFKNMIFNRPSNLLNAAASGVSSAVQMLRGANAVGIHCEDGRPELSEADMVVFLGDFNYRLHGISYDEARDFVSQRCFDWLRERDQLRAEMKAGRVFQGMREGLILFPPTYKFERHQPGLGGYDSGEKKRIPAWCDRIIYRDNRDNHPAAVYECNLSCPVISSILLYEAIMDVTDSDHKPVRCMYNVDIARVDESLRRQEFGEIIQTNETIRSLIEKSCDVPEITYSLENIFLQNQNKFVLQIANRSEDTATFEIFCEGQSTIKEGGQGSEHCTRGTFGFPRWLEVIPAVGVLLPGKVAEVSIQHKDSLTLEDFVTPQNWWSEDARDKEVMLILRGRGSFSTATTTQRILLHHSSSSKPINFDKANDPPLE